MGVEVCRGCVGSLHATEFLKYWASCFYITMPVLCWVGEIPTTVGGSVESHHAS